MYETCMKNAQNVALRHPKELKPRIKSHERTIATLEKSRFMQMLRVPLESTPPPQQKNPWPPEQIWEAKAEDGSKFLVQIITASAREVVRLKIDGYIIAVL